MEASAKKLFLLLLLLISLTVVFYWHTQMRTSIARVNANAQRIYEENRELAKFAMKYEDPAAIKKTAQARVKRAEAALPAYIEQADFLSALETQANVKGVHILSLSPGNFLQEKGYARQSIALTVRGDYFSLLRYMGAIDEHRRFVNFGTGEIKAAENGLELQTELFIFAKEPKKERE